jgi:cysteinyl-tRNA synthetase, unknown class
LIHDVKEQDLRIRSRGSTGTSSPNPSRGAVNGGDSFAQAPTGDQNDERSKTMRTRLGHRRIGTGAITALLAMLGLQPAASETAAAERAVRRALFERVERWGCQYQNIDVAALAASPLDLVVIEPTIDGATKRDASRDEVAALQLKPGGGRRLVLAYLSIGAAEEYRRYWRSEWRNTPPPWLGAADPDWPRSHAVKYWLHEWQTMVVVRLEELIAAGYDGVFLDRVDAYDWHKDRPTAQAEMIAFVARLREEARKRSATFLLVGQNAEPLLASPAYREAIDAVSKESLLTGLHGMGVANTADEIAWSLGYLRQAQAAGLPVLAIEYLDNPADIARIRRRLEELRMKPFFGTRLLDRMP